MLPDGYEDRNDAFSAGVSSSPTLQESAMRYNSQVPHAFQASGTNQQIAFSGIGSSSQDKKRQLLGGSPVSGSLPTANGFSADTYENKRPFLSSDISSGAV
jgi:hypothetical protein